MAERHGEQKLPRGALVGAAALILLSIVLAGAARLTGIGTTQNPVSAPVERLELRFEDRADGAVAVYAAEDGRLVDVIEPGTNGFLRSVVRGLARERRREGVGREPAFVLTRWVDGRLSLADPETGRAIELGAFGPTNLGAFAGLLAASAVAP